MNIIKATESDGIELLYNNKQLTGIPFDNIAHFNKYADLLELEQLVDSIDYSKSFNIPQRYKELDVEGFLTSIVEDADPSRQARVLEELAMFRARNLFPVLQLLIYIVDTMRKHNLVWGVGRGSSVASYCLYLIGVHKIDSVKYNLDIREFLK
jgi:DNA polymerase III alpha subunit